MEKLKNEWKEKIIVYLLTHGKPRVLKKLVFNAQDLQ